MELSINNQHNHSQYLSFLYLFRTNKDFEQIRVVIFIFKFLQKKFFLVSFFFFVFFALKNLVLFWNYYCFPLSSRRIYRRFGSLSRRSNNTIINLLLVLKGGGGGDVPFKNNCYNPSTIKLEEGDRHRYRNPFIRGRY